MITLAAILLAVAIVAAFRYWLERRRRRQVITVHLVADTTKFQRAIQDFQRAAEQAGRSLGEQLATALKGLAAALSAAFDQSTLRAQARLYVAQNRHGAGNRAADGTWLSDMCSAWVHESCPGYACACRCHQ